MEQAIWEQLATAGLPALLMALAVWYLKSSNDKLVAELHKEREERLDSMAAELDRLRERSDACERDRLELHRQMAELIVSKTQTLPK